MKNILLFCLATSLCAFAPPRISHSQAIYGGGIMYPDNGRLPYQVADKRWSFEAEVIYENHCRIHELSKMVVTPTHTTIKSWRDYRMVPQPIDETRPPSNTYYYDTRYPLVFTSSLNGGSPIFRPTFGTSLLALKRMIDRDGADVIRKRYNIPATFPLTDYDAIRAERYIGAHMQQSHVIKGEFGPNFLVNEMPSGFGWPMLMFRLTLFTPDAVRISGFEGLKPVATEKVAGWGCTKYTAKVGRDMVSLWVEPTTQLVLREVTYSAPMRFPGDRMPPAKPYTRGYTVRKFRLLRSAPTNFLPQGAVVELPESLYAIPLPSGVKRRHMTGMMAKLGFPIAPFPSNGTGVIR